MRVERVHVRFYKAFNYDYLRKFTDGATPRPWERMDDGSWYPFVEVPLSDSIATIVGANESGKSQILHALEIALTGTGAVRSDFCRYSRFFVVEGDMPCPDFGVTIGNLGADEIVTVAEVLGADPPFASERFTLIRQGTGVNVVYWPTTNGKWASHKLSDDQTQALTRAIPQPFWMDAEVPLPSCVPIALLAAPEADVSTAALPASRQARRGIVECLTKLDRSKVESPESVQQNAVAIASALAGLAQPDGMGPNAGEIALARDLLLKVAGIDSAHFEELVAAIADGRDGYVSGIEEEINHALATNLNFRRWWSQDSDFQLRVAVRETDLAFIIRDRTGTDYSFSERSHGLRYFLSYFVQYLAHEPSVAGPEILLMDEPDAFLSSQGQRDLLKIFDAFAFPIDDRQPCAVAYVTHSPFLIDRNHAERICVLEKGDGDEGTRVVRDAARNHYEPLRSAFGSYVAETTFMGSCNLMVEGQADQVLLAGLSTELRSRGAPRTGYLNLNEITIVPAGGATHVPYLVYLARGRDVEKPAVIVLLDGDPEGEAAHRTIKEGVAYRGTLLEDELVLHLDDSSLAIDSPRTDGQLELEDLIPTDLARLAGIAYACHFLQAGIEDMKRDFPNVDGSMGVHRGVERALQTALGIEVGLSKVGFARHVVDLIKGRGAIGEDVPDDSRHRCFKNFESVLERLGAMQRKALTERESTQLNERVMRITQGFLVDFPTAARRTDVQLLLEQLSFVLDSSREAEEIRSEMRRLADAHDLKIDPNELIADFESLRGDLERIPYLGRQASADEQVAETEPSSSADESGGS